MLYGESIQPRTVNQSQLRMFASEVSESFLPGRRGLLATVVDIGISVYLVERELEARTHIPVGITPWYLVDDEWYQLNPILGEKYA